MASLHNLINLLSQKIDSLDGWINNKAKFRAGHKDTAIKTMNDLKATRNNLLSALDAAGDVSPATVSEEEDPDVVDFGKFLSDIGKSVVDTQRQLDKRSKDYLQDIKDHNYILPSVYRIPKVSAEIKFGMRKKAGSGFNIIIAKKQDEEEASLNQSMQFEILSVPPPPDFQQTFYQQVPAMGFVFSRSQRAAVFSAIAKCDPKPAGTDLLENDPARVLILELHPQADEFQEDYLLLYAQAPDANDVGIWHLRMSTTPDPDDADKPVLENILKFTRSARPGENYEKLHDFVIKFSDLQQNLL